MAAADNHGLASHFTDMCIGGWRAWRGDSDVLCTHWSVCSFVTSSGVAAGHWCVSLYVVYGL